jgi:hypothetical protein
VISLEPLVDQKEVRKWYVYISVYAYMCSRYPMS